MNLLLIEAGELRDDRRVRLEGRRADHLRQVLGVQVGTALRVGILGQGTTRGVAVFVDAESVTLKLDAPLATEEPQFDVALALPRPKALSRTIQAAASFGVRRLLLFNAWRVEKSFFSSPRLRPDRLRLDAWLGCEQGAQVHVPSVSLLPRFTDLLDLLDREQATPTRSLVLHPHAAVDLSGLLKPVPPRLHLVLGPEGGFIPRELDGLEAVGCRSARLPTGPLKTEVALAAALGVASLLYPDNGRRAPGSPSSP